jgi:hypothetical protein
VHEWIVHRSPHAPDIYLSELKMHSLPV